MSRSFFCAKSSPAGRTKATASKSRGLRDCQRKSSIVPKKFSRIWKIQAVQRQNQGADVRNRRGQCPKRKSRSWTCCKIDTSRLIGCVAYIRMFVAYYCSEANVPQATRGLYRWRQKRYLGSYDSMLRYAPPEDVIRFAREKGWSTTKIVRSVRGSLSYSGALKVASEWVP